MHLSPEACAELVEAVEDGLTMFDYDADFLAGATDCPQGCAIESDGFCRHGWLSAQETMLRTVAR